MNSQACVIAAPGTPASPRDAATAAVSTSIASLLTDDVGEHAAHATAGRLAGSRAAPLPSGT